jgi:hypothetical protein
LFPGFRQLACEIIDGISLLLDSLHPTFHELNFDHRFLNALVFGLQTTDQTLHLIIELRDLPFSLYVDGSAGFDLSNSSDPRRYTSDCKAGQLME